jgi:hypothetical protein
MVSELDAPNGEKSNGLARDLVQLLMEVHGTGLERLMEIIAESGASGEAVISLAGQDPIVRSLLLLYSLHPDDLETRVMSALDAAGGRLRKFNSQVELLGISEGAVRVRISTPGHACGSTTKTVQSIVEESLYDLAPDLASLEVLGPAEENSSGFVPLESLLKHSESKDAAEVQGLEACAAD